MGKITILLSFLLLSSWAVAFELPPRLEALVGKTFAHPGPNCFAAALYGAGVYTSFRGVSEREFSKVIQTSCVETDTPIMGDIGVYSSRGFGFTHAFMYLDADTAFEKPGVDYVGRTPIRIQAQEAVDYIHIASAECRQYGDESCHNQKSFYRCGDVSLNPAFEKTLERVNTLLDQALQTEVVPLNVQNELGGIYWTLEQDAKSDLEKAIFVSVQKQMEFFRFQDPLEMLIF